MFASLFPFSRFLTTRLPPVLWRSPIVGCLVYASLIGAAILREVGAIFGVLGGIVTFAIMLLLARVWIEIMIVLFCIAEHTRDMAATLSRMAESARETMKV